LPLPSTIGAVGGEEVAAGAAAAVERVLLQLGHFGGELLAGEHFGVLRRDVDRHGRRRGRHRRYWGGVLLLRLRGLLGHVTLRSVCVLQNQGGGSHPA
jgi:hypothetical protein